VVIALGFRRDLHGIQSGKVFVGEFGDVNGSPIQAPQALILLGRKQYHVIAAMAGHDHSLSMSHTPKAAEFALKLTGRDSRHGLVS
jgi:hypothetical protein